jgi:thymidine kinase
MTGSINVIIGCMFSGKTSELIKIARRNRIINKNVIIINYSDDLRYSDESKMMSHDRIGLECISCRNLNEILNNNQYPAADIICINEGQFYENLHNFCTVASQHKHVYVCGLDGDYLQRPFGEMLSIIPIAENVERLHAFCKGCNDGTLAFFTKRIADSDETVLIGGEESYIPVCRKCLRR